MGDLHIRIDEAIALEATQQLAEMGLTVDQAVHILLSRVADEKRLPFTPNAETIAAMEAAERGEVERFGSFEAMMADARKDDRAHRLLQARSPARAEGPLRPRPR